MIEKQVATVWLSSTKGRRYLSKSSAINAEALAIILNRYPVEPFEDDTGHFYDIRINEPVRFEKMYRRLKKIISKAV